MTVGRSPAAPLDRASRRWVEQLHPDHPRHGHAAARLHDVLQRAALHELNRRRGQLPALTCPERDDVAQQCADDAMMKILARVDDFEGRSRFTTNDLQRLDEFLRASPAPRSTCGPARAVVPITTESSRQHASLVTSTPSSKTRSAGGTHLIMTRHRSMSAA